MAKDELKNIDPETYQRDKARVERGFWPKVKRTLGQVPFLEDAVASYYVARDPKTPFQTKAILFGALGYFILPADVIPDIIALAGFTDDAAVLYAAIKAVTPHIKEPHRAKAREALGTMKAEDEGQAAE
ncbi:MAG: YkvA family protein [Rhodovibrionaceae bacterium]